VGLTLALSNGTAVACLTKLFPVIIKGVEEWTGNRSDEKGKEGERLMGKNERQMRSGWVASTAAM
jgi:hypothetical protein